MEQTTFHFEAERRIYTVASLTQAIRSLLGGEFGDVWVAGEISGSKLAASGHYYFNLKDDTAQLRAVLFKGAARYLKFRPQDGMAVLARGRVDVYEQRGEYQLIVETLEPQGLGALQLAFEQLKKRLEGEGLFAPGRKRPLPRFPRRIGIVTSPSGAVIRDILNILERRFPGLHIRLYPALVQGAGSVEAVVEGLGYFSRSGWAQVVIVARGGGSLEDLWTFNEEAVARAIAACSVPVISAIGHETDFTIADFVADLRAPTPSAAAELVICTRQELVDRVAALALKMEQSLRYRLARAAQPLDELDYRLRERLRAIAATRRRRWLALQDRLRARDPRLRLAEGRRRLEAARARALHAVRLRLDRAQGRHRELSGELRHLSPLAVLERGYSIVENEAGEVVRRAAQAPPSSLIQVRLAEGRLRARVSDLQLPGNLRD